MPKAVGVPACCDMVRYILPSAHAKGMPVTLRRKYRIYNEFRAQVYGRDKIVCPTQHILRRTVAFVQQTVNGHDDRFVISTGVVGPVGLGTALGAFAIHNHRPLTRTTELSAKEICL